ncbi:MAG: GMC family oxidoreductase [Deltaproteobacteria bacterium]|nr:GMC family oxidoreductase [Deltaproteobacteria bacterium]
MSNPRSGRFEDVVIGSGAGGAVIAARLAEAGRSVVLLEEGPRVGRADFNQREGAMYSLLYRDAGGQATADGAISVMQGRCLGGSTTINMGDVVPMETAVLQHWRHHFGWSDWGGITDDDVHRAAQRAKTDIGASRITDAEVNTNNGLLRDGAKKLGIAGQPLEHNRTGCVGSGYCLIGCAYDAKKGTHLSYVPRFEAAGGEVWCDARVDRVEHGAAGVVVSGVAVRVEAERVFVCAGTIHTPGILERSGLGGGQVGRNLSLQPQGPVLAVFPHKVDLHRGIPQSFGVDGPLEVSVERGLGGFTIEGVAGGPAMTASLVPLPMRELKPLLGLYRQSAAALCLVPDRPSGRVVWSKGRPKIHYAPTAEYTARLREALKMGARCYLEAGASAVRIPVVHGKEIRSEKDIASIDDLPLRSCDLSMISAHPQGTCRMGPDGAVGMDFKLKGTDNVYVCDASLFPTTSSTHTMVPVMTMAHLLAGQLGA